MFLKIKDCDEPFPREGPDPESRWGMVFDGAVNAYGKGISVVMITPHGSHIPFTARLAFDCTNNMAEYEACIMGLEEAICCTPKFSLSYFSKHCKKNLQMAQDCSRVGQ